MFLAICGTNHIDQIQWSHPKTSAVAVTAEAAAAAATTASPRKGNVSTAAAIQIKMLLIKLLILHLLKFLEAMLGVCPGKTYREHVF